MLNLKEVGIVNLEQLYLVAIVNTVNAEKLTAVLQDFDNGAGRLWLVREGSTVPSAEIEFKFDRDVVHLGIISRNERSLLREVKYAEGIDGFLEDLQKFLRAGLLAHKRAA